MLFGLAAVALVAVVACATALLARNVAIQMERRALLEADDARKKGAIAEKSERRAAAAHAASLAETYRALLSETRSLRAGREPGWREKAIGDLAKLAVMQTPRRDMAEIRTEAVATLGTPDIRLSARIMNASKTNDPVSLTFSPNGKTLFTASSGLDLWDVAESRHLLSHEPAEQNKRETFQLVVRLPHGLAIGTQSQGVIFTDTMGDPLERPPITQGDNRPKVLKLSADNRRLVVVWNDDAGTTVHDADTGEVVFRHDSSNRVVAISPDGSLLAHNNGSELTLLSIDGEKAPIVVGRQGQVTAIDFSPNGQLIAASSNDHTTKIWDIKRREHFATLRGHKEKVLDVAFSPDGEWIATGSLDYTTRVWETSTGQNIATLTAALPGFGSPSSSVDWSPSGEHLAVTLMNSNTIAIYQISGRNRVEKRLMGHGRELRCVAAHPKKDQITTSGYRE